MNGCDTCKIQYTVKFFGVKEHHLIHNMFDIQIENNKNKYSWKIMIHNLPFHVFHAFEINAVVVIIIRKDN